tara:strand:+ start:393 stop:797 length:405 start_codon:yes stop_codon:yes gene_type:complete
MEVGMFLFEFFMAIIISFIVTSLFVIAGKKGPWSNLGSLFLVVFLVIWAGGIWLTPIGPQVFGSYLMPFIIMAGLLALLLANIIPHKDKKILKAPEEEMARGDSDEMAAIASLGASFWIFILAVALCIGLFYVI